MRVVFFGTPIFATPFLFSLIEEPDIDVLAVVTQPDKPAGRGNILTPPPCKEVALSKGIEILQPSTLKGKEVAKTLEDFQADLFVVVAYGKLIPTSVLSIPPKGCINVHPSLLPAYRGPTPLQAPILHGDPETGITIMLLDEGMDTGPILASEHVSLDDGETVTTLTKKMAELGPRLLIQTLKRWMDNALSPIPQDNNRATVTKLISKDDGHVDWNLSMIDIERQIRAFEPWPGTWSMWKRGEKPLRLKILEAAPTDMSPLQPPGGVTVKDGMLLIDAADGSLEIHRIQLEGKAPMSAEAFLTGYADIEGTILE